MMNDASAASGATVRTWGHGIALLRDPYANAYCQQLGLRPVASRRVANALQFFVAVKPGPRRAAVEKLIDRFLMIGRSVADRA